MTSTDNIVAFFTCGVCAGVHIVYICTTCGKTYQSSDTASCSVVHPYQIGTCTCCRHSDEEIPETSSSTQPISVSKEVAEVILRDKERIAATLNRTVMGVLGE